MRAGDAGSVSRRGFLRLAPAAAALLGGGGVSLLGGCDRDPTRSDPPDPSRQRLPTPTALSATAATLTAAPGVVQFASGSSAPAWLFNTQLPGPTLRARTGERASIRLVNALGEPTIVHWHGLHVPPEADGHPRFAIGPGATFDYDFSIVQRAGTHWYHPHAHHRTGAQIQRGLAGFFIVSDAEEDALALPSGPREILLLLQDRSNELSAAFDYAPTQDDHLSGMLRDVPFGNGAPRPTLDVVGARYRFRILNAAHARIFRLGLDNGTPLTVIGNDGGLIAAPVQVESVFLGVGERVDVLLDFRAVPPGARMMLKSLPFSVPYGATSSHPQGMELDVLELVRRSGDAAADPPLPAVLSTITPLVPAAGSTERTFVFRSTAHDAHHIDGRSFEMDRVDEQVPLGQTERWRFHNDSTVPHPIHLHGTHFQVGARSGGRGVVFPYERGWKDTVLLMPLETVEVLVRFDRYGGIFPLHCHNLQHEDMGMMLNIEVL
jgi:blue copper oxidase